MCTPRRDTSMCSSKGDDIVLVWPEGGNGIDIIPGFGGYKPVILHRPDISLDPSTAHGMVTVSSKGWLKSTTAMQNRTVGHSFPNSAIASRSLRGPIPVYFAVEMEVRKPIPRSGIHLSVILASRQTLSEARDVTHPGIYAFLLVSGNSRLAGVTRFGGRCRLHAHDITRRLELGILLMFQKKQLVFIDVARQTMFGKYAIKDVDLPMWIVAAVTNNTRVRIKSGSDIKLRSVQANMINSLLNQIQD